MQAPNSARHGRVSLWDMCRERWTRAVQHDARKFERRYSRTNSLQYLGFDVTTHEAAVNRSKGRPRSRLKERRGGLPVSSSGTAWPPSGEQARK